MPNNRNLHPRVQEIRDALRARRQQRQQNTSPGPDPFLTTKPGDLPVNLDTGGLPAIPKKDGVSESDPFLDSSWARLNPEDDPRQTHSLHHHLAHLDEGTLLEAASDAIRDNRPTAADSDPEIYAAAKEMVAGVLDDIAEREAMVFISQEPRYVRTEDNLAALLTDIVANYCPGEIDVPSTENSSVITYLTQHEPKLFTAALLHESFDHLYPDQIPDLPEGVGRSLTVNERRTAQVISASGDTVGAIMYAMGIAHPELRAAVESGEADIYSAIADSRYADSIRDIVFLVWETSPNQGGGIQEGYVPSEENKQAIFAVIGSRPVTVALLTAAWRQVKRGQERGPSSLVEQSERARARQRTGGPSAAEVEQMSEADIEALSDDEVAAALQNAQLARADAVRQARRKLL